MRRRPAAASLTGALPTVLLLVLAAGCSGGSAEPEADAEPTTAASAEPSATGGTAPPVTSSPSATDISDLVAGLPPCPEVWVDGSTLPADYAGCKEAGGGIDLGVVLECADGAGLAAYHDRLWAHLGGEITNSGGGGIAQDPEYAADVTACQG
ncbi:hypothetical protein [Nocardioides marmotae]|uniref:hypothetical protein n=1 Tax=Nocardioides marmotae TaxID=2663857 RepID=UPI0012B645DF|nr:hypothetical protein [Nocardioides marmotae]MBC9732426.1 hypothetical protein [Nocardioides marmotae]MTB83546.1 hypothetical protein [Nocardioides marmotae]